MVSVKRVKLLSNYEHVKLNNYWSGTGETNNAKSYVDCPTKEINFNPDLRAMYPVSRALLSRPINGLSNLVGYVKGH